MPWGGCMRNSRGFTLVELMVTIAIVAIIAMMAAPSFGQMLLRQKLNNNARNFITALNQAKSQAALLRTTVAVCPNKTNSDDNFTKEECASAVIPNYSTLNATQKLAVQNDRVFQVEIDPKVTVQSASMTAALFNPLGSVNTQASFSICASGMLSCLQG